MNWKAIHNVYFIGVGGIGMSALAKFFCSLQKNVAGYDKNESEITTELQEKGVSVHYKDSVEAIPDVFLKDKNHVLVVYTPAIPATHKELNYFFDKGFTVLKRSEVLGKITEHSFCLAVAGTHGKTTTSSILGHIMKVRNATSFLGGITENNNSNLILGAKDLTVVEADEFDRSFLQLSPSISCITSMDADHLDIYHTEEEMNLAFQAFAEKSQKIIVAKGLPVEGLTYAIEDAEADYYADNLRIEDGEYVFDVHAPKDVVQDVSVCLPGRHNVMNTLAAIAMANLYGISLCEIKEQIKSYKGVKRRFSYPLQSKQITLIDDYAHHPSEIKAVREAVYEMYPKERVLAVFQPHLFSRTKDFVDDFAKELSQFDELLLLDIYPARELPVEGVTSSWLLGKVLMSDKKLVQKEDLCDVVVQSNAKVVVMMGAGDIGLLVDKVKQKLIVDNGLI